MAHLCQVAGSRRGESMARTHSGRPWVLGRTLLARWASQTMAVRINHQLKTIGHVELRKDGREVMPHGRLADAQAFGNLLIPQPLTNERYDFSFPLGEHGDFGSFRIGELRRPRTGHFSKHVGDHGRLEPDLSGMHFLDSLQEHTRGFFLQDKAHSAKTYRLTMQIRITHPRE